MEYPVYTIQLVKESVLSYDAIASPLQVKDIARDMIGGKDREHMLVFLLDTKNKILGINTVSIGSLNSSIVHPREVFKAAILLNACSILLAHNHPSGDVFPSQEDIEVTKRMKDSGKVLGIFLLDHIIVSHGKNYYSFLEQGKLT